MDTPISGKKPSFSNSNLYLTNKYSISGFVWGIFAFRVQNEMLSLKTRPSHFDLPLKWGSFWMDV